MSDDYDQHIILQHLDDPLRFLNWTIDEASAFGLPIFFGIAVDYPLYGVAVAIISFFGLKSLKKRFGLESLKHALYWHLPRSKKKLPQTPSSHIREYIG
jgi:conjugal transfer pilus assembly protein TraL